MAEDNLSVEEHNKVDSISGPSDPFNQKIRLEEALLAFLKQHLDSINGESRKELNELHQRQDKVTLLHKLMQAINSATTDNGSFDCSDDNDLKDMLTKAKDLGVNLQDGKFSFNPQEKDRLLDNIKMTADDFNVQNDMQIKTIERLNYDVHDSYGAAKSIAKELHEIYKGMIRGMNGRG